MNLPLRACAICGSWNWNPRPLCVECHRRIYLLSFESSHSRWDKKLQIHSLLPWGKHSPAALKELIHAMKSADLEDWKTFARWLLLRVPRPEQAVLVPVPPRIEGTQDHAWKFAQALAEIGGWDLQSPLQRVSERAQKFGKKRERQQVRFRLDKSVDWSDYRAVVLVDDIITTGSTVKACYEALGRPRNCLVWTLMDRLPCGVEELLL